MQYEPTLAEAMYNAYNAGGSDPAFVNKNFRGDPCPAWSDLPQNVREKWEAAAVGAVAYCVQPEGDFGWALNQLRQDRRVRRAGWNGKGMWLALTPGSVIPATSARSIATISLAGERAPTLDAAGTIDIDAHIDLRTASGTIQPGWNASQPDMLATDWQVVE